MPAAAKGNRFRTFVCLDNLDIYISCTGNGVCAQEQKMAETVFIFRCVLKWWVIANFQKMDNAFIETHGVGDQS